jgi:hypothetical protein
MVSRDLKELVGSPAARPEAEEEETLAAALDAFRQTTQDWCRDVLQQIQPTPRPPALPATPWSLARPAWRAWTIDGQWQVGPLQCDSDEQGKSLGDVNNVQ